MSNDKIKEVKPVVNKVALEAAIATKDQQLATHQIVKK